MPELYFVASFRVVDVFSELLGASSPFLVILLLLSLVYFRRSSPISYPISAFDSPQLSPPVARGYAISLSLCYSMCYSVSMCGSSAISLPFYFAPPSSGLLPVIPSLFPLVFSSFP